MSKLILTLKGRDDWDRPVYECNGLLYVDVDPRKTSVPQICTKSNFYSEPCYQIKKDIEIEFVPSRDTW